MLGNLLAVSVVAVSLWKSYTRYDFSSCDGQFTGDLNVGLSAADLEPAIILSEPFSNPP